MYSIMTKQFDIEQCDSQFDSRWTGLFVMSLLNCNDNRIGSNS